MGDRDRPGALQRPPQLRERPALQVGRSVSGEDDHPVAGGAVGELDRRERHEAPRLVVLAGQGHVARPVLRVRRGERGQRQEVQSGHVAGVGVRLVVAPEAVGGERLGRRSTGEAIEGVRVEVAEEEALGTGVPEGRAAAWRRPRIWRGPRPAGARLTHDLHGIARSEHLPLQRLRGHVDGPASAHAGQRERPGADSAPAGGQLGRGGTVEARVLRAERDLAGESGARVPVLVLRPHEDVESLSGREAEGTTTANRRGGPGSTSTAGESGSSRKPSGWPPG